jgi:TolB-like protein
VRVTARLVDVHSAKLVWSDSYEYPAQQLAEAQELAAREIAVQVGAHLAIQKGFVPVNH